MLRFIDGFDGYSTADLAARYDLFTGSFAVAAGAGRFSSGAATNTPGTTGGSLLMKYFAPLTTVIFGFAWKFSLSGLATRCLAIQDGTQPQVELGMNASNQLVVTTNGGLLGTGTTVLAANAYHYIECKVVIGSASGSVSVRIDGVPEITLTGVNTNPQGTTRVTHFALWHDQAQPSIQNWFDDYYICDGSGATNNDFLGNCRVETLLPAAQGAHADFARTGAASNYGGVNEASDDGDASYVSSATLDAADTYTYGGLASTPALVFGVQTTLICRRDDTGPRALTPLVRSAGVDYLGTQLALTDIYSTNFAVQETNPATTAAWTAAAINALESGFKVTN